jgi:hypothetical protein
MLSLNPSPLAGEGGARAEGVGGCGVASRQAALMTFGGAEIIAVQTHGYPTPQPLSRKGRGAIRVALR